MSVSVAEGFIPAMKGGQDASGPEAFGVRNALACTHFSMVHVQCASLLVDVSNFFFFQEGDPVVIKTNAVTFHPIRPLCLALNGISPAVRLGDLYDGGQIC